MSLDLLLPLESLQPGDWAEVSDVSGDPGWVARLAELGVRLGARLQMIRAGSPCMVHVAGSRLSLRGANVLVRPVEGGGM